MGFKASKILSAKGLSRMIKESNENGERFCFILGSGASVESGIPSGNSLEMQWMNCLMGKADDRGNSAMDADETRAIATALYNEKEIEHSFEEIEAAWVNAKKESKAIPSKYYFDIYKLRFHAHQRNGYSYMEKIMEQCEPSLGYHTLAKLLTKDNLNNLVITTNFDSLVEDALFLYTDKRPLVVSHESLADYIEANIQRPIIAKVHRGLMYAPFNSPETTNRLKDEWRNALSHVFSTYTPVVIGYAGGDRSLMAFLEEDTTVMRNGIYWCYREESGFPEESIQSFVEKKRGFFVKIDGFDALMMEIGETMYKDEITPSGTEMYLKKKCDIRVHEYNKQWDELNQRPTMKKVLQPMNEAEQRVEDEREKKKGLTSWDHIRRGNRADEEGRKEDAIKEYTEAIDKDPENAAAYNNRGCVYDDLGEYEKAIEDYTKAIELDVNYARAYNNRGIAYKNWGEIEKAIEDYTKAIELDLNYATAYNNRGSANDDLGEYEKAIEDYTKAIELDLNDAKAYNNRGVAYKNWGEYEKAIEDYNKAIELNSDYAGAYNNRGNVYDELKQYKKAIEDYNKAIELDSDYAGAYNNRGVAYKNLKQYEKAIEDYSQAIKLNPKYKIAYQNRAKAYRALGEEELAKKDEKIAAEL